MSLLDTGRETVTIYPMELVTDPDGNQVWQPSAFGEQVVASVQPIATDKANELAVSGQQVSTVYRVRTVRGSTTPVGPWAKVSWDGREWDLVGEVARHNGSPATAHTVFRMAARQAKT